MSSLSHPTKLSPISRLTMNTKLQLDILELKGRACFHNLKQKRLGARKIFKRLREPQAAGHGLHECFRILLNFLFCLHQVT